MYGLSEDELVATTLDAFAGTLRASGARPDAFVVWHVLEHVEAPLGMLSQLRAVGQPDVSIIIQTPLHLPILEPLQGPSVNSPSATIAASGCRRVSTTRRLQFQCRRCVVSAEHLGSRDPALFRS